MPSFYDGNTINRLSPVEGAAARIVSRKTTNPNSRKLRALMVALNGAVAGGNASATSPYIVQAVDGKTGGLVTIGTKTLINRATTEEDIVNIQLMFNSFGRAADDLLDLDFILDVSHLGA